MKILVIKQTSLGDVLHSTGHVRTIKQHYPTSELVLLTANSSAHIYKHNKYVDRIIVVDRYQIKANWWRHPRLCFRHMREVLRQVQQTKYDLAFDLQGLAKSVLFLYGAEASKKFVKGNWLGIKGFKRSTLHALEEMDGVLALAGINAVDTSMELATSQQEVDKVDQLLASINPENKPIVVFSPFSRWASKNWPMANFIAVARALHQNYLVLFTATPERAVEIEQHCAPLQSPNVLNLAGQLALLEFAELVRRASLMLSGDSFPMHVAVACKTPVIALFAPTDETRVGPKSSNAKVVIAPDCNRCDRRDCQRGCLGRICAARVIAEINSMF